MEIIGSKGSGRGGSLVELAGEFAIKLSKFENLWWKIHQNIEKVTKFIENYLI